MTDSSFPASVLSFIPPVAAPRASEKCYRTDRCQNGNGTTNNFLSASLRSIRARAAIDARSLAGMNNKSFRIPSRYV
ncbi:unnamed protein product, partial [Nesidiocoris tenuis]